MSDFKIEKIALDKYETEFPSKFSYNLSELSHIYKRLKEILEPDEIKTIRPNKQKYRRC